MPAQRNAIVFFLKLACVLVALAFLGTVVLAQTACPYLSCNGPEGDGWMLPLFAAPFGLPALLASAVFLTRSLRRALAPH